MAEKPEPELTDAQRAKFLEAGQFLHALASDPRTRKQTLSLIKQAAPDTVIPELDLDERMGKEVEDRVKPHADKVTKLETEVSDLRRQLERERFRDSAGISDEELVEVETLAKEGGISKAETALEYWRARNALGTPRATPNSPAALSAEERAELIRHPKQWATKQAQRVLREMRGGRTR